MSCIVISIGSSVWHRNPLSYGIFEVILATVIMIVIVVQCNTLGTGTQYSYRANIFYRFRPKMIELLPRNLYGFPGTALDVEVSISERCISHVAGTERMQALQRIGGIVP